MQQLTGSEDDVERVLTARSVAVIGASGRPGTLSWRPLHLLRRYGFGGQLFAVNPARTEIDGVRCFSSVAHVGEPIDVAMITLSAAKSVQAVRECAAAKVGAVVLPAQGFGELGEAGRAAEREMLSAAGAAGMRIVGPNTDGLGDLATGTLLSIQPLFDEGLRAGDVAVITQSGASAGSLIARLAAEGIGCGLYASAGNEIDLGLCDYLSVAVQDPRVRMVLSFVEAIRRPEDFTAVARMAAELGKPIVLIKVGRTQQAAQRAAAHTGALAGADRIYDAVFRSLGVIRVGELSELVAVAKFYLSCGAPGSAAVGIMSVSGGQAGAMADCAAGAGLSVPPIGAAARERLTELLPFGTALNPCDLTGDVATRADLATLVYQAFDADPAIDTVVYVRKALTGGAGARAAQALAAAAGPSSGTPLAVYAMDGHIEPAEGEHYQANGIPAFGSAAELFTAVRVLAQYRARRAAAAEPAVPAARGADLPAGAASTGGVLDPAATRALLAEYGIAVPPGDVATEAEAAVRLAESIGYPVVMKLATPQIAHKTEVGGVVLGVAGPDEVRTAFGELLSRARQTLGSGETVPILVEEQVRDAVEMIAGVVIDAQFGPFVMLGMGGVLAELLADVVLRPAPVSPEDVLDMVGELRGRAVLGGFRGAPARDVAALAALVSALSRLGAAHRDALAEFDLNPIMVRPAGLGAVAADALIVLRPEASDE